MPAPRAAALLAVAAALAAAAPAAHGDVVSLAVDAGPHGPGDAISVSGAVGGAGEDRRVTIQVKGPGDVIAHRETVEAGADGRFSVTLAAGEPEYRWGDGAYQVRADHAGGSAVEVFAYFAAPPAPGAGLQAAPAAPPTASEAAGDRGGAGPGPLGGLLSASFGGIPAPVVAALAVLAPALAAAAVWSRRRGAGGTGRAAGERAAAAGQQAQETQPAAQAGAVPVQAAQAPAPAPPQPAAQEPRAHSRHEAALREPIPDDGYAVVIDSNVYLDMMTSGEDGSGWDGRISERYHPRLAVPREALREVGGVMQYSVGCDATRLPAGRDMLREEAPDEECLRGLEEEHARAAQDPGSDAARFWLRAKARFLAGRFGDPEGLEGDERREALKALYGAADSDRRITAIAAAIAAKDGKAYLVTSDGDMLVFRERILEITGNRLELRRPEAAGASGRRGAGGAGGRAAREEDARRGQNRYVMGKRTTMVLFGSSVAHPLAEMLGGAKRELRNARALREVWEYVSAGGGKGRACVTGTVRKTIRRNARHGGFEDGLGRLLEAAYLDTDVQSKKRYAAIVREIFADEELVPTGRWARRKATYLRKAHGIEIDEAGGGYRSADGGGEVGDADVRKALMAGAAQGDVDTAAEAMCAAEMHEAVLVTDDGNFEVIGAALLRRIMEMRTRGESINPVWVMGLLDASLAAQGAG